MSPSGEPATAALEAAPRMPEETRSYAAPSESDNEMSVRLWSLGYELRSRRISVTLVSPGYVESELHRVDNRGVLHPDAPDAVPAWLRMDGARAARQIVAAVARRRSEVVITGHGKAAELRREDTSR